MSAQHTPTLRAAARDVLHQRRDVLAVRQSMRKLCSPLGAVLKTHDEFRAAIAKATGSAS